MTGYYCSSCEARAGGLAKWRDDAEVRDAGIRNACLILGQLGYVLHLALAVELADECHAYAEGYYRSKWDLTDRLNALRGEP